MMTQIKTTRTVVPKRQRKSRSIVAVIAMTVVLNGCGNVSKRTVTDRQMMGTVQYVPEHVAESISLDVKQISLGAAGIELRFSTVTRGELFEAKSVEIIERELTDRDPNLVAFVVGNAMLAGLPILFSTFSKGIRKSQGRMLFGDDSETTKSRKVVVDPTTNKSLGTIGESRVVQPDVNMQIHLGNDRPSPTFTSDAEGVILIELNAIADLVEQPSNLENPVFMFRHRDMSQSVSAALTQAQTETIIGSVAGRAFDRALKAFDDGKHQEAVREYWIAANFGNRDAQVALARLHRDGVGVPQNSAITLKWLETAAERGAPAAQHDLAEIYSKGTHNVRKDSKEAYFWALLAGAAGEASMRDRRDDYASVLTGRQIADVQDRASGWRPIDAAASMKQIARSDLSPVRTTKAPRLTLPPLIKTQTDTVAVEGTANGGGGTLVSIRINDRPVSFDSQGAFSFGRAVPMGSSTLSVVATNEWGVSSEAKIVVERSQPAASSISIAKLDPSQIKSPARPNSLALIIGIDEYDTLPNAAHSENDARVFFDYATNVLGVPSDRVRLLTGENARRLDIEKSLVTWLMPQLEVGKSEVFVFFSGHGLASADGETRYLLPFDGDQHLLERSAIRRSDVIRTVVDAGAKSLTLFLDTCYSGGTRGNETLLASARPVQVMARASAVPRNVTILSAAAGNQLANSLPEVRHGLFSYHLMRALQDAAAGPHGEVTAGEIIDVLRKRVPRDALRIGRVQEPQLNGNPHFVLIHR